ncbi:hypothetical protein CFF8240_1306 [Campylobacter fetus subsp. fetus 82-40]|uniref:Uncharacterized protein n=1 Tax=Campylobacter fetus subsp. fetus (strain 82-40) TaxID=360106 RepID=A0RQH6_CAMFF|nr:hypothetical protein CFF8240_1306 [Campylobacter fetus subsp. fetus 82-40]
MRVVEFASYDFYFYQIYFTRQPSPVFRLSFIINLSLIKAQI